MSLHTQLPGARWFRWLRNAPLRVGVLTGIYLSVVFLAWLLIANRLPSLESIAETRNLVAGIAIVVMMAIPVVRFRHEPARLFAAGLTAWVLLTAVYLGAELWFSLLESRMGALRVLILGVVSYGLVSVFEWVLLLCVQCHHHARAGAEQVIPSRVRSRTN